MKKAEIQIPRFVIAATNSGAGKTTVTLGIIAALKKRGLTIQGFKCGPDYIDPGYHTAVTGRPSHNLDSWFVKPSLVKKIFLNNSYDADISVIEGVMGLFDGRNSFDNEGSTAHISHAINAPVALVLDARSMARSAAAIVRGFQVFSRKTTIAAVIANKVGSQHHLDIIRESVEKECKIPVIGGILRDDSLKVPERHLGLLPALERGELDSFFNTLAGVVEKSLDLDRLLQIAGYEKMPSQNKEAKNFGGEKFKYNSSLKPYTNSKKKETVKIAIARDGAFNFYYPENLELMRQTSMELVFFSPLKNEPVPGDVCGLYLGGGFPEEFAQTLSENLIAQKSVAKAVENGMPAVAECGGFMYLTGEIVDRNSQVFAMTGILPGRVVMQNRLAALGYREILGLKNSLYLNEGETIRGHEFHYSVYEPPKPGFVPGASGRMLPAYRLTGRNVDTESGISYENLIAGYAHFYFLSNPKFVRRWAELCRQYKTRQ